MLKNWIKIYLYQVRNNKLFTALNILGLSTGIAGLIFAMLYWNDEHAYNDWVPEKERTFQVINDLGDMNIWSTNIAQTGPLLKQALPQVENYCYLNDWYFDEVMSYNGKKQKIDKILDAQGNFFAFYPFEFIHGNPNQYFDRNSIVISDVLAKRIFGDENPMGKQIQYSGATLAVKGVYKIEHKSSFEPMAVTNFIDRKLEENKDHWGNFNFALMIKLKDAGDKELVEKQIRHIYYVNRTAKWANEQGMTPEEYEKQNGSIKGFLEPLSEIRLHSQATGNPEGKGNFQFLAIMFGLSILILLLSIVNYVNLATANAIKRAKEVGVRKILGASKNNIIRQFIFETALNAAISILLALVIVELALPFYNDFLNKNLLLEGNQFYTQLILIFILMMFVAGIFPAIYVANFETLKVLKGNFGRSKSGVWLRNGMLVFQFAIASFFIIGSYIVYLQIQYMGTKDLGFKGEQVVQINYRSPYDWRVDNYLQRLTAKYETTRNELKKIKGVKQVSGGAFSFGKGANSSSSFSYNNQNVQGKNMSVDFDMIDMMQIKLAKGRKLSPEFSLDTVSSIMLNETAVRIMREKDPIGKEIDWNGKKLKIVGIVKDFHIDGPQDEIPPMTIFHYKTIDWMLQNFDNVYVKINAADMETAIPQIEKFWTSKVDTEYPFTYDFVDKNFARSYENYVSQRNLFSLLNVVVILIALSGLFALATYSIQRRMKEIAIRKTLGAETQTLLRELSKQYVIFCLIGFLIAVFPAYYLLDKWLENFAFRIPISPLPFVIGFVVLLLLTLAIVLSKAYQATRIDILKYLKYE